MLFSFYREHIHEANLCHLPHCIGSKATKNVLLVNRSIRGREHESTITLLPHGGEHGLSQPRRRFDVDAIGTLQKFWS